MKRFWLAVFFFAFCFSAAGTAFAADDTLLSGSIKVYTGAYDDPKVEKGQVLIKAFILDDKSAALKDIPYEWGLYLIRGEDDYDVLAKGREASVTAGTSITVGNLEAGKDYTLYIWAKAEDWDDYKGNEFSFQIPAAGEDKTVGPLELTEKDVWNRLNFDDSSGCSVFGLGAGLLALAGLALLGKKSGR
jgi:hypothetical protein